MIITKEDIAAYHASDSIRERRRLESMVEDKIISVLDALYKRIGIKKWNAWLHDAPEGSFGEVDFDYLGEENTIDFGNLEPYDGDMFGPEGEFLARWLYMSDEDVVNEVNRLGKEELEMEAQAAREAASKKADKIKIQLGVSTKLSQKEREAFGLTDKKISKMKKELKKLSKEL